MTNLLGIDFGIKKVGFSLGQGKLAQPLETFRYQNKEALIKRIKTICEKENIEKIVVGISEGQMGSLSRKFSQDLKESFDIPIVTFDETLTTHDAQALAIASGIKRAKRRSLEDAFAATVMLQSYLDYV